MSTYGILNFRNIERLLWYGTFYFCSVGSYLIAQPAQLDFRHYSVNDGVPSSEVYTVFEDKEGFLWLGTDNGVARFDGYEFTVFDQDDGLEDTVVFTFRQGPNGKLWASTYSGRFFFFEDGRFHPYVNNEITIELKKKSHLIKLLDVTEDNDMIVRVQDSEILKIFPSGEVVSLAENIPANLTYDVYLREHSGQLNGRGGANTLYKAKVAPSVDGKMELFALQSNSRRMVANIKFDLEEGLIKLLYAGVLERTGSVEIVMATDKEIITTKLDGETTHQYPNRQGKIINFVLPGKREGEYWYCLNRGNGIELHDLSEGNGEPQRKTFLEGHSVSSGLFDSKGGFWVTTLDDGLYYSPYPDQKLYLKDDDTENTKSVSLAMTGPESFYAGYDDGTVFNYEKNEKSLRSILLPEVANDERMYDLFYDSINENVYTPYYHFKHPIVRNSQLDKSRITYHSYDNKKPYNFVSFNYLPRWYPDKLFATSSISFSELNLSDALASSYSSKFDFQFIGGHVLAADAKGKRLLGTIHGLYEITANGRMIADNLGVEELSGRVVFIKSVNEESLLFGTRGSGLVYYDQDTSYLIRESDGLASDMIRDIHEAKEGVFWISTLSGLSKVTFYDDGRNYDLRTFRIENGLPSNEIAQVDTWGDEVWLATSVGIMHFIEPPIDSFSPAPTVRKVLINGLEVSSKVSYSLPAGRQGVSIQFGSINHLLGDQVLYRYRNAEDAHWQYTTDRTANFPNLVAGSYQFAVQSQNQDGFWSESTYLDISVATPWYQTWWAIMSGAFLLIGSLSAFFLLRERRRKHQQKLLLQINELEHAALHAQMNPHFVFNALNSIQNFVLENNAKQAATYLSRFARVIRQTLRSSVEGKQSLKEELAMLHTYLVLEKLRFKDGFNYELTVDPALPLESIDLPPLLIQPFVENAIIHGLKERERGGWISRIEGPNRRQW